MIHSRAMRRPTPKPWHGVALVGIVLISAALFFWRKSHRDRDVIIITVDTLRADHLGAYGYAAARTPNIDRLARSGVLFTQATTPMPRTTPALASLFTGLWPHHHGSREVTQPIGDRTTLAEVLKRRGYATRAVISNPQAGGQRVNLHRGYDDFIEMDKKVREAEHITPKALEVVRQVPAGQPLFLWVHYWDPHFPYGPPESWSDQPKAEECRRLQDDVHAQRVPRGFAFNDTDGVASRALQACTALYDADIAYTDHHIGLLLDGLRSMGRLDKALLVFAADPGENLGEEGLFFEHGPSLSDASLRIPLMLVGAGLPARTDAGVARLEDVMPTLLSLVGEPHERWPAMDGADLSPRLGTRTGQESVSETFAVAESGNDLYTESFQRLRSGHPQRTSCVNGPRFSLCKTRGQPRRLFDHVADPKLTIDLSDRYPEEKQQLLEAHRRWPLGEARERAVRTPRFKLVEDPQLEGGYRQRLYDLHADPQEQRNLAQEQPDVVAKLAAVLHAWATAVKAPGSWSPDEVDLESLRALGYVQ